MLQPAANKAAPGIATPGETLSPSPDPCPRCGVTGKFCRPVSAGYWCQQHGLLADESTYLHPTRDPQAEQLRADPQRLAAELEVAQAADAFAAADEAWQEAAGAAAECRLRVQRDPGSFGVGGWRPSKEARLESRKLAALEERAEDARRARERAAGGLEAARVSYGKAHDAALARAGLPRVDANAPSARTELLSGLMR